MFTQPYTVVSEEDLTESANREDTSGRVTVNLTPDRKPEITTEQEKAIEFVGNVEICSISNAAAENTIQSPVSEDLETNIDGGHTSSINKVLIFIFY